MTDQELRHAFAQIVRLIEDTSQSLQTEMEELRNDMERGFDRMDAATRRNTTSLAGGAAAIAALNRWAKTRDHIDSKRDREASEVRARVRKLEQNRRRQS